MGKKGNSSDSYANDGYCNDFSPQYHGENDDQHSHFGVPNFRQTQVELNISLLQHRPPLLHTDLVDSEDPKADHESHKHLRSSSTATQMLIRLPTKDIGFLIGKILGRFTNTQWIIENFGVGLTMLSMALMHVEALKIIPNMAGTIKYGYGSKTVKSCFCSPKIRWNKHPWVITGNYSTCK